MRFLALSAAVLFATSVNAETARDRIIEIIVAVQCPDLPEALDVAIRKAREYSTANPSKLSDKDLTEAIDTARNHAATETNLFARAMCEGIVSGG